MTNLYLGAIELVYLIKMKRLKSIVKYFTLFISLLVISLYLFDVDYLLRAVRTIYLNGHTTAFLGDYEYFPNREINNSTVTQPWVIAKGYNQVALTEELTRTHKQLKTVAYLIIKEDSIWHESYFDGYSKASYSNSFSMAKSIVSAALGKAIMQNKIQSLDQKVVDFFPELTGEYAREVTVGDLASMASGISWDERYYSPFSIVTRAYFDDDLKEVILGLEIKEKPGERFKYLSGSTQLLAMCIEKATGEYLSDYVSKEFWIPMGAEHPALWQLDRKETGIEKAYCCIASNARDFARFGKLYLNNGKWQGKTLLDSTFVKKSVTPRFKQSPEYGYGWWLETIDTKKVFYMRGHLGQFTIVIPEDNLIIVRLGHLKGKKELSNSHSNDLYTYVREAYKMINKN